MFSLDLGQNLAINLLALIVNYKSGARIHYQMNLIAMGIHQLVLIAPMLVV